MKTIILSIMSSALLFITSCSVNRMYEGTYRVASVKKLPRGQAYVKLEGLNKEILLPTDTLKRGDLVYLVKHKKFR